MAHLSEQAAQIEANVQAAVAAYQGREYNSICAAALAFSVLASTLRARLAGRTSRSQAYQSAQILSDAKKQILVQSISRLCWTGFPISLRLLTEMAKEVR